MYAKQTCDQNWKLFRYLFLTIQWIRTRCKWLFDHQWIFDNRKKKFKSEKNWLSARKVVTDFKLCHDENIMNEWNLHLRMWYVTFTRIIMYDWSLSVISGYEFVWISFRGRISSKSAMIFANMMYYYSETAKNDKKADHPAKLMCHSDDKFRSSMNLKRLSTASASP